MARGEPSRSGTPSAPLIKIRRLQSIRNILFQIPGPTHGLNSGSTDRRFGQEKFVIFVFLAGAWPSPGLKSPRSEPAFATRRCGPGSVRCGLTLVFFLITCQVRY